MGQKESLWMNMEMAKKKKGKSAIGCPFCKDNLLQDSLELTNGVSYLRKNKMPIIQNSHMYVLIESLVHDTHFEDMKISEALRVLNFAFDSMEWAKKQHPSHHVLLFKNRGLLSGGSQPHPHMQVVALPHLMPEQVDFKSDHTFFQEAGIEVGLKTEGNFELFQFVVRLNEERDWGRAIEVLQRVLRWTADKYGNYNLAHWREDGKDQFKIIPRWAGSAYFLGYNHSIRYDESELEAIQDEIRQSLQKTTKRKDP